jgi:hypothetical protein
MPTISCIVVGQLLVIIVPDNSWHYIFFCINKRISYLSFTLFGKAIWEYLSRREYIVLSNIQKEQRRILSENHRIESLLKVLLPPHIAQTVARDQRQGKSFLIAQDVQQATVMFVKYVKSSLGILLDIISVRK